MDDNVLAAMKRWPDVPAVSGWLSLSVQGQWRLHPAGDACTPGPDGALPAGEPISNPQLLAFLSRNYNRDDTGRWYVQNGPQRVYVRLDAAPFVVATSGTHTEPALQSHTGSWVPSVQSWWIDSEGRLFVQTPLGPGLIAGRDTAEALGRLQPDVPGHRAIEAADLEALERDGAALPLRWALKPDAHGRAIQQSGPLRWCDASQIPVTLGFVALPRT